jgi:hypothetical protein
MGAQLWLRCVSLTLGFCLFGTDAIGARHLVHGDSKHRSHHKRSKKTAARKSAPDTSNWMASGLDVTPRAEAPGPQLSNEQINQAVASHKPEIRECLAQQRAQSADQNGTLLVSWVIEPSGEPSGVTIITPELAKSPLATCLADRVPAWKFPAPGHAQDVSFPFRF